MRGICQLVETDSEYRLLFKCQTGQLVVCRLFGSCPQTGLWEVFPWEPLGWKCRVGQLGGKPRTCS
jgi:hypothetical protein